MRCWRSLRALTSTVLPRDSSVFSLAVLEGVGEAMARRGRRRAMVVLVNCMVAVGKYEKVERSWNLFACLALIVCGDDERRCTDCG